MHFNESSACFPPKDELGGELVVGEWTQQYVRLDEHTPKCVKVFTGEQSSKIIGIFLASQTNID